MWSKNPYCATASASCNACKGNKRQIRSNFLGKRANWLGTPAIECPLTWPLDRSILKHYGPGIIRQTPMTPVLWYQSCHQDAVWLPALLFQVLADHLRTQLPALHIPNKALPVAVAATDPSLVWTLESALGTNFKLLFLMLSVWPSRVPAS